MFSFPSARDALATLDLELGRANSGVPFGKALREQIPPVLRDQLAVDVSVLIRVHDRLLLRVGVNVFGVDMVNVSECLLLLPSREIVRTLKVKDVAK